MKRTAFFAVILMLTIDASTAIASAIRIGISSSASFQDGKIALSVNLTNHGDEPAYSLKIEGKLATNIYYSRTLESLQINKPCRINLDLGSAPKEPGVYTLGFKVHYTDAGGYPFSIVSSLPVITTDPDDISATISARLPKIEITDSGAINLDLSTRGTNTVNASITLVCPDELSCVIRKSDLSIKPGTTNIAVISITNLFALSGSTYPVIAIIDYPENGMHRSIAASGFVKITRPGFPLLQNRTVWGTFVLGLLGLFFLLQLRKRASKDLTGKSELLTEAKLDSICDVVVLLLIFGCLIHYIPPKYLFMDTTTTGGDTPAHNYLASHLKDQLFHHGRIVSWSNGWWCGFPMFQYYFCLPYLLIAILSVLIPFNIAFKIVSVLGIFGLPVCAYACGRMLRLQKPVPIILSITAVPFLFIGPQTMWGANIYSTFAGMISNSISFPLMLLFIASSWRDADDGTFRIRTTILLTLLLASHFFTSIIGGLCAAIIPFLNPKSGPRKTLLVLASEYILALMLMAWWLIPLIAKGEYAVAFGANWNIGLTTTLPSTWLWLLGLLAVCALVIATARRIWAVAIFCWMLLCSTLLFYFGHDHIAKVFVNTRLWPFAFFALLALSAAGTGLLIARLRFKCLAILAILLTALSFGIYVPNNVRNWAEWNYRGFEKNPRWTTFQKLGNAVSNSPGLLANDLHPDNQSFGSGRAFECFPHLFGKNVLEGGIVNSAASSIFSYYIQSETSKDCAGFPDIVRPASFNFTNATKHMKLFNVKHFVARWKKAQESLAQSKDWRLICESEGWQLYELLSHSGGYVYVPDNMPVGVHIQSRDKDNWKIAGLEWIYTIQLVDEPFVFLLRGEEDEGRFQTILSENDFLQYCRGIRGDNTAARPSVHVSRDNIRISSERVTDNTISFKTSAVGLPHIIKCSYSPNWKVTGAKKIFMVTPCFMLVYPEKETVELNYGYTLSDNAGRTISLIGLMILLAIQIKRWRKALRPGNEQNQR